MARAAHELDLKVIAWSVHSRDTFSKAPERVAHRVLATIGKGDIALFHDGHESASHHRHAGEQSLPAILAGLKQRGLKAVTVSELLTAQSPVAA